MRKRFWCGGLAWVGWLALASPVVQGALPPYIIRSDYLPGEITTLCAQAIDKLEKQLQGIESIPPQARNLKNTLLAFEHALADFSDQTSPLIFMASVSRDLEVRPSGKSVHDEGSACEEAVGQFLVATYTRKPLYLALKEGSQGRHSQLETRLRHELLTEFELNGLRLTDEKLAEMKRLKQQLSALEAQFSNALNNDQSSVEFSEVELQGVSAPFLGRLKKSTDGKKWVVTTKSTDYQHVMENAVSAETRKKMLFAYVNRAMSSNVKLLEEAIALRQKVAEVMGFKTWADYRIQKRMARNGQEVLDFLTGLRTKLSQRNQADLAALKEFYREDRKKRGLPFEGELRAWDLTYASFQLKQAKYSLDDEKVREYFPANRVIEGMFDIYSKLFGVSFIQIKEFGELGAQKVLWSPDVQLYSVVDAKSEKVLAYFYTDFIPRPGKYGHAAAFSLISGRAKSDGKYSTPVSAIVANLAPPAGDRPSLLSHQEVETVFHEFGHIMHQILTRVPFASLSGSSVPRDFVEAPSQMLENWVWSPEILPKLSGHYKNPNDRLPKDLLGKLIEARDFNRGYYYTRQLLLGLLDLTYHTQSGPIDTTLVYDRLAKEITGVAPIEGGHFQAGFGHLMGGYDAGYYGYLWSEVYAQDLFSVFQKKGLLNQEIGRRYRQWILEKGNSLASQDLLKGFLGRKPSSDAFFQRLGVKK